MAVKQTLVRSGFRWVVTTIFADVGILMGGVKQLLVRSGSGRIALSYCWLDRVLDGWG